MEALSKIVGYGFAALLVLILVALIWGGGEAEGADGHRAMVEELREVNARLVGMERSLAAMSQGTCFNRKLC